MLSMLGFYGKESTRIRHAEAMFHSCANQVSLERRNCRAFAGPAPKVRACVLRLADDTKGVENAWAGTDRVPAAALAAHDARVDGSPAADVGGQGRAQAAGRRIL